MDSHEKSRNYMYICNELEKMKNYKLRYTYSTLDIKTRTIKKKDGSQKIVPKIKDGEYVKISDFEYEDKIYAESQYKYGTNSLVILTGEHYDLIVISVKGDRETLQKFNRICKENKYKNYTLKMKTFDKGYQYYFKPCFTQKERLRHLDLSNIRLFDINIDAKYNDKHVHGPTIIIHGEKRYETKCITYDDVKLETLPDLFYNEIIRQSTKNLNETKNIPKPMSINKKLVDVKTLTESNDNGEKKVGEEIETYTKYEIKEVKNYINEKFDEFANEQLNNNELILTKDAFLEKFANFLKNEIFILCMPSMNSIKKYCKEFLIFTRYKKNKIKGTKLVQRYKEYINHSTWGPKMIYPFFSKNGLTHKKMHKARVFLYVRFRNKLDYE